MELVTVSTAFNPAEAELVRSRLEAAGFHASVRNEHAALSLDVGRVQVQVPEDEVADAKELLESSAE